MNDLRQAALMALEALMQITTGIVRPEDDARMSVAVVAADDAQAAIDALRAALSAQTELVARVVRDAATVRLEWASVEAAHNAKPGPLYTHHAPTAQPLTSGDKLWLWKNGDHYLAFRHPYPCFSPGGDPMTLGEPAAIAEFRESHDRAIKRAHGI